MARRSVFIATPSYDRKVDLDYMMSFADTMAMARDLGVQVDRMFMIGDCYIHKARNTLVDHFMNSAASELLFIDADVAWNAIDVFRLLALPYEFAIAAYPYKQDEASYPAVFESDAAGNVVIDEATGCYSTIVAPSGFMKISRSVFEKMAPRVKTYGLHGKTFKEYFSTPIHGETWFGEDVNFSREWLAMGEQIWCLPDVQLRHVGSKGWEGNLAHFIASGGKPSTSPSAFGVKLPRHTEHRPPGLTARELAALSTV